MQWKNTRNVLAVAGLALAATVAPTSAEAQARLNFEGSSKFSSGPAGSALLIDYLSSGQVAGPPSGTVVAIETIGGEFDPEIVAGTTLGVIQDLQFAGGSVVGAPLVDFLTMGGYTFSLEGVDAGGNFGPITLIAVTPTDTLLAYSVFGSVTGGDFGATSRNYQGIFTAQFSGQSLAQVQAAITSPNGTLPVSFTAEFVVPDAQVVPEPATVVLLGTGVAALGLFGVRRRNAAQA